jgi:uncharacterized iron-regulated membrane protein
VNAAWAQVRGGGIRQALFWAHLGLGIAVGLVIAVLAATGMILACEEPALAWAERGIRRLERPTAPLPMDALAGRVLKESGAKAISGFSAERDPMLAWRFQLGRDHSVLVNPSDGRILGRGADGLHAWFHKAEELHRWFLVEGKARDAAKQLKNAANAAFLFIILSGIVLWWPKAWTPAGLKAAALPSLMLKGKARDFNWHSSLGLIFWPAILTVSMTGLILSYAWATDLLYRAMGEAPPTRPAAAAPAKAKPAKAVPWAAYFNSATKQAPQWVRISARAPRPGQASALLTVVLEDLPPPRGRGTLRVQAESGQSQTWEPYVEQAKGRKLRLWARWTHTGQSLGWLGQAAAFVTAAVALLLVCTGLALSWRRFFGAAGTK